MLAPVYKQLSTEPNIEQLVLALTTARATFEKKKIPFISFKDFISESDIAIIEKGKQLASTLTPHPQIPPEETFAYLGLSYADLCYELGDAEAASQYEKNGRSVFLPKRTMEKLFNRYKPDLVIATNSPRAEKAALEKAQEMKIQSLCIVDLFTEVELRGFLAREKYGTKICVLNDIAKNYLIKHGRPANEILVTGNPAFDVLFSKEAIAAGQLYRKKHGLEHKKVILWARSTLPQDLTLANDVENKLIEIALKNPQYVLIVRPHPNEPPRSIPPAPNIIQSSRAERLEEVLQASDIVCNLYSTVGVEAFLIGKDVVQMTGTEMFHSLNCVAAGMATGADSVGELTNIIDHLASQRPLEKEINIVHAAQNIKAVILDLIHNSPSESKTP